MNLCAQPGANSCSGIKTVGGGDDARRAETSNVAVHTSRILHNMYTCYMYMSKISTQDRQMYMEHTQNLPRHTGRPNT